MIKLLCFAVCLVQTQADRAEVQLGKFVYNNAQVRHGYVHRLDEVPELETYYDQQFDNVLGSYNANKNYHGNDQEDYGDNKGYGHQTYVDKKEYGPEAYVDTSKGYNHQAYVYSQGYDQGIYDNSKGYGHQAYVDTKELGNEVYDHFKGLGNKVHDSFMKYGNEMYSHAKGYGNEVFDHITGYGNDVNNYVEGYGHGAYVASKGYGHDANGDSRQGYGAPVGYAHDGLYSHEVKTYGRTFDVKSDFYNDQRNVFKQKHVPAMYVSKVYQAEKVHDYNTPTALDAYGNSNGNEVYGNSRHGYAAPVKGYAHGDDYKFSGRNLPTTAGHYVGYGNKYDFRHGYPYGYGELLDITPAGHSLHSGSTRLMTKQPKYEFNHAKYDHNQANTHGFVIDAHSSKGYGYQAYVDTKGYGKEIYDYSRQGYAAPVKGYAQSDNYKFSGRNTPTAAGHYVGYGDKHNFRHGYPYGYGEMLVNTPVGYSLKSGSNKLMTKHGNNHGYAFDAYTHGSYGHNLDTHSPRNAAPGYAAPDASGHYVGYGNKYDFRHGYPYGYGEMLDKTPHGYSLHSGSKYSHKQPHKYSNDYGYNKKY